MRFYPRPPILRLILLCLVFGFLIWALIVDARVTLEYTAITDPGFVAEKAIIGLFLLSCAGFTASYLLLQFRLRFTEEGIYRRTLFKPHFIRWADVKRAQVGSYKGYFALELWVSRRRWVSVPLLEYGRGATLFAEIRKRLPVEVAISEKDLSLLNAVTG